MPKKEEEEEDDSERALTLPHLPKDIQVEKPA